jgi:diadenosine tetraphosphatase ApaH/serine/threonine PP2A family protein phosphatase
MLFFFFFFEKQKSCLVVFGGRTSDSACSNDIYVLCFNFVENTVFWMQPECAGQPPSPRYNHTMVAIENKIYVFGGRTINADGSKTTLNDLYMLNLDTLTWHRPSTAGLSPLPSRCWHTCTGVGGLMYVVGGYSDTSTFGDVHVLDSNARFKLPKRSSQTIQNLSGFQASFTDLTQMGPRSLTGSDSRARLLGSVDSLANMLHKKKLGKVDVPTTVIDILRDCFVMLEQYNYEWDQPSHEWVSNKLQFLELIEPLCKMVKEILMKEPILVATTSPSYILGDLHANFKDLMFFAKNFWGFGMKLCPANVLFLGDYVDRGPHSLEVIVYLFALKALHPKKVILLRGNHEFRDVNGDMELYESTSFKAQCIALAGKAIGLSIWEAVNSCFDWMPLASIMDKKIFCVHGGIPRYTQSSTSNLLHDIASIARPVNEESLWLDQTNQMPFTFDLVWADPAEPAEEAQLAANGKLFAENERGGNTVIFSRLALDEFFRKTGCSYVVRAHQRKDLGVEITKGAKVLTVFSSSHYW